MLGLPLLWAGPMGKAHCLNKKRKKKEIKSKSQNESWWWFGQQPKKVREKTGEEGFEKEKERG